MSGVEKHRQRKLAEKAEKKVKPGQAASRSPSQQTPSIQQSIDLAMQHHIEGRLPEAESIYQQILQADPNQPIALHLLGLIAYQMGKSDMAVNLITQAITIKPDYAEAHNNLGLALLKLGRPEDAVASYRRALATNPDLADGHYNLGIALLGMDKLEGVLSCFQSAVRLEPGNAEAHFNLGNSLKDQNKLEDAVASYQNVLAIDPGFIDAYANLGLALWSLGKLDEAVASYQKGLVIQPDNKRLLSNLAITRIDQDRLDEAIECLKRADPSTIDLQASYTLLECFYRKRDWEEFEGLLEQISKNQRFNFRAASTSAFASHQLGTVNSYKFCDEPFDLITTFDLLETGDVSSDMLTELEILGENNKGNEFDSPAHVSGGFVSNGNLFAKKSPVIETLEQVIGRCVEKFLHQNAKNQSRLFRDWPEKYNLRAWSLRLLKGGEAGAHIHQAWLSGVFYVRVPANKENNSGNIEFTLNGYDLPVIRDDFPTRVFTPQAGRLFLFPSSLPHRVLPFSENQERISISFDIYP